MSYPIPGGGLLGERPVVAVGRERTERAEQIESDTAQGPAVKAKRALSAPSLDEWDGHLAAGHVEYRGLCPFCVADRKECSSSSNGGITRPWASRPSSGLRQNDQRSGGQRASPILVGRLPNGRWMITHTPCTEKRYSALMDCWEACERRDHEWRAKLGGGIRSGSVDC